MSDAIEIAVLGVGAWAPEWQDWNSATAVLCGNVEIAATAAARPAPAILPPTERRRAPESVLLGVDVALQACTMAGIAPADVAHVFASSYGELSISDYLCETLAKSPLEVSPIRFHNSVHNAAVGYWTIATGCHAPSTAVAAQAASFGAGLLEAVGQVLAEQRPVLLVCSDSAGSGPLTEITGCTQPFACALVLAPAAGTATLARLDLQLVPSQPDDALPGPLAGWRRGNPSASSLALLAMLAGNAGSCRLAAAPALGLQIAMEKVA